MKKLIFFLGLCLCVALDLFFEVLGIHTTNCIVLSCSISAGALAAIGIGSSMLSGIFGANAQQSANEYNLQIARETNANNYKMFQEQLGFNREMYHNTNAFNTPAQQRLRYEQAGINPYFALGNIVSGNAQMQTAPSPNPAQAPHLEAVNPMQGLNAVPSILNSYYQNKLTDEQATNVGISNKIAAIDLQFKLANERLNIRKKIADLENVKSLTDSQKQTLNNLRLDEKRMGVELDYLEDFLSARNIREKQMAKKEHFDALESEQKAEYQKIVTSFASKIQGATLQSIVNQAYMYKAAGDKSSSEKARIDKLTPLEVVSQTLVNGIKANEYQVGDFNLSAVQLEQLRSKGIIERRNNSWLFRNADGFVNWLTRSAGNIFGGLK